MNLHVSCDEGHGYLRLEGLESRSMAFFVKFCASSLEERGEAPDLVIHVELPYSSLDKKFAAEKE